MQAFFRFLPAADELAVERLTCPAHSLFFASVAIGEPYLGIGRLLPSSNRKRQRTACMFHRLSRPSPEERMMDGTIAIVGAPRRRIGFRIS